MHSNIVTDEEVRHLPVPEKLFAYADAYLTASITFSQKMTLDVNLCTWPNGAVALMLAAHSVELFLKGAILQKNPTANVWAHGHNIERLASDFRAKFPIEWDIPFGRTDLLFETDRPEWLANAETEITKSPRLTRASDIATQSTREEQKGEAWRALSRSPFSRCF